MEAKCFADEVVYFTLKNSTPVHKLGNFEIEKC